jgi:RecJ-like exonuclease
MKTREVRGDQIQCSMCAGLKFSQFEDPCSACGGEGYVNALVFVDCGHVVESSECAEAGCTVRCCECGKEFYVGKDAPEQEFVCGDCKRVDPFPVQHKPFESLREVESQRVESEEAA